MRKGRANDPGRPGRIRKAALELIAEEGMRATTQRKVAARAGVPLGSVTYYFPSIEDLLLGAFEHLIEHIGTRYDYAIIGAGSPTGVVEVLVDAVRGENRATLFESRAAREFYQFASVNERAASLVRQSEKNAIGALRTYFSEEAARAIDALIEGWWSYQSWSPEPLNEHTVRRSITALIREFDASADEATRQSTPPDAEEADKE